MPDENLAPRYSVTGTYSGNVYATRMSLGEAQGLYPGAAARLASLAPGEAWEEYPSGAGYGVRITREEEETHAPTD